jgi:AraC family transcriptional regulator
MPRQKRPATTRSYHERVLRSLVEIERDPVRPLVLEALAQEAFLSPFHFHRVFSALVGEGPAEYARRLRLEQAAHDLAVSKETIRPIAKRAGYARQESFTRAFRARFGSTPSAFRAEHRGKWTRSASGESRQGRVEIVPPLRVAFIRHVGPYEGVPAQFDRLARWAAAARGRMCDVAPLFLGLAHDNPALTPPEKLRFDCCVAISADVRRGEGDIGVQTVLGGRYGVAVHQGSFATLATTYRWLALEFLPGQQLVMRRAPAVEIYLTPPDVEATDGLTEVLLPIS